MFLCDILDVYVHQIMHTSDFCIYFVYIKTLVTWNPPICVI